MIDIHCHILPEVDDGAYSMDEALAMARLAVQSGVTDIVTTPHFKGAPQGHASLKRIVSQFQRFQMALERKQIPLQIHHGVEMLCIPQVMELAEKHKIPTLGNSDYVLVEFYFDAEWEFMDATLEGLRGFGYRPVVAHPERYGAVQRDVTLAERWFAQGYVLQINKGSIFGAFGRKAEDAALRMLYRGIAHVLASDAHTARVRTPDLEPARQWCLEHMGRTYTNILLEENPRRILENRPMYKTGHDV